MQMPVKGDIDMTEKQHEFCRDFKALMEKYSITKAYGDHRHGVLHFVSNGLDFVVYSYFADRNLVPVDEWGTQDAAD